MYVPWQDGRLLAKLEAYWTWIKDDERMVGLNPYHWVRQHRLICQFRHDARDGSALATAHVRTRMDLSAAVHRSPTHQLQAGSAMNMDGVHETIRG